MKSQILVDYFLINLGMTRKGVEFWKSRKNNVYRVLISIAVILGLIGHIYAKTKE